MMTIDVETLRRWLEEGRPVTVLDVRPAAERAEWAIPGSLYVDAYDALKVHDPAALADVDVPGDGPVVTVCAASKTSLIAAEQIARHNTAGRCCFCRSSSACPFPSQPCATATRSRPLS